MITFIVPKVPKVPKCVNVAKNINIIVDYLDIKKYVVEKKNINLISEWTDKHPKFTNSTTKENDEYLQILIETMGGKGDYEKNKNKVVKNIAKEVIIEK